MLNSIFKTLQVAILFFLLATSLPSFAQWQLVDSINISPNNYKTNFKQINDIVNKKYSHLKTKQLNIASLFIEVEEKISNSKTKEDYFRHLQYYFSKLKNSHTRMFLNDYGINCSSKLIENRLFMDRITNKTFTDNGVQRGDEIISIDNTPSFKWLELQRHFVNSSTNQGALNAANLFRVFSDTFKATRLYEIRTVHGIKKIEVILTEPANYSHLLFFNEPKASGKILNNKTAYIEIKSMTGNVVKDFVKSYKSLHTYQNLIIDLRRNSGGNSDYGEQIAQYLIETSQKASVSRKKIKPHSNNYKGNIYVLTGAHTGSAAESFALDLRESGNTILVGSPTNGDTGNLPKVYSTEYGLSFSIPTRKPAQVSFKGFPMEGIGIPPHHKVELNIEDYKNNKDTVLEYALNLVGK